MLEEISELRTRIAGFKGIYSTFVGLVPSKRTSLWIWRQPYALGHDQNAHHSYVRHFSFARFSVPKSDMASDTEDTDEKRRSRVKRRRTQGQLN
jgi:hypothetical protein